MMAINTKSFGLEWLREAAKSGEIHTVRFSFGDHLGAWRGKRIPIEQFLSAYDQPLGFCNAMLICDVQCDILEETPFSNYSTGYPDMHIWPDISSVRPAAWAPGEAFMFGNVCDAHHQPLWVAPRNVLSRVVENLASLKITASVSFSIGGRLMRSAQDSVDVGPGSEGFRLLTLAADGLTASGHPVAQIRTGRDIGSFRILLEDQSPMAASESALVLKGAVKELARQSGLYATFMTRSPGSSMLSIQEISLSLMELEEMPDPQRICDFLNEARVLLQPSVNAFKMGPSTLPRVLKGEEVIQVHELRASSEADPFTSLAVMLAALDFRRTVTPTPGARSGGEACDQLADSEWAREWLGPDYIDNALPLSRNEFALFAEAITDWETARYWSAS
jgi:glutamine synthetase